MSRYIYRSIIAVPPTMVEMGATGEWAGVLRVYGFCWIGRFRVGLGDPVFDKEGILERGATGGGSVCCGRGKTGDGRLKG